MTYSSGWHLNLAPLLAGLLWLQLASPQAQAEAVLEDKQKVAAAAVQAFAAGDMAQATKDYEQLIQAGVVNGHLFYNLGVAYFKAGRLGDSVAAFLGARRYLPRDPDNEANLRFALGKIHDKLEPQLQSPVGGPAMAWLRPVSQLELGWTTALLFGVWGTALAVASGLRSLRRWQLPVAGAVLLPVLAGVAFYLKTSEPDAWGAVVQPEAKVYSGPGSQNTQLFALQEGAPVLITERAAGGYYRVKLSDGKQGWVADNQVRLFGPL